MYCQYNYNNFIFQMEHCRNLKFTNLVTVRSFKEYSARLYNIRGSTKFKFLCYSLFKIYLHMIMLLLTKFLYLLNDY